MAVSMSTAVSSRQFFPIPAHREGRNIEQLSIPCAFMRGGSSRGGFFLASDLPSDPIELSAVLLACYGSPDGRQIDGIGGADPLTSKAAVVSRSSRPDADIEYTFYQIGIDRAQVSTGGNCGNMLAAVGPFAMLRGLIDVVEPETTVRIYNINTHKVIVAHIPVVDGGAACEGVCEISGVPDPGAPIQLDFGDCAGAVSGKLLPTGNVCDSIMIEGRKVEVSFVDAATSFVFVAARDIGGTACETPEELSGNAAIMEKLEAVRGWAAVKLGLVDDPLKAKQVTPNIPRVIMVAPSTNYRASSGRAIAAEEIDVCVRQLTMQRPHKALAVTGAACTAVAAAIPGSVVAKASRQSSGSIRLGHPSGILNVASSISSSSENGFSVQSARIERTARLIMDGTLFARRRKIEALKEKLKNGDQSV